MSKWGFFFRKGDSLWSNKPESSWFRTDFGNWLVWDGILRLQWDRYHLWGLSWDSIAVYDPDCGCRFCEVILCLLPMITLSYEWYRDNPKCPDVQQRRAGIPFEEE